MIYYFYGPDSYRRNKNLRSSIAEYRKKYPAADIAIFDLEESPDDWIKAKDFIGQPSLFVDSKVAVIKESGSVSEKEWIKTLKSELESPRTFLLIADSKKPLKAFSFLIEAPAKSQFFGELEGNLLEAFVKSEAAARGLKFKPDTLGYFLKAVSGEASRSWAAANELDKLSFMKLGQPLALEDLRGVLNLKSNDEVFSSAREMMYARDKGKKIGILENLFLQKKEAAYIFNSLAFIARGKDLIRLADYDVSVKSGNLEYEEALLDFVLG